MLAPDSSSMQSISVVTKPTMKHTILALSAITICAAVLPSQTKALTGQQFLLDEYTTVAHIDMQKMRDTGIWDELNGSTLKMILGMAEEANEVSLDAISQVTSVSRPSSQGQTQEIIVIEGTAAIGELGKQHPDRYQVSTVGARRILLDQWSPGDAVMEVTPKLRVYGPSPLIQQVLNGRPRGGLPSADVMSFTAVKKDLLIYAVFDLGLHTASREILNKALADTSWPADDAPTFACIRVLATGDEDDPHLTVEVVLRHGKDGDGLAVSEKAVTDALARVRKMQEARILRPLLKKIEHNRDGTDATWRLDLGRARDVAGLLGTLSPFLMFTSGREVQAVPLQVVEETAEEEAEAPKPKRIEVTKKPQPKAGGGKR
jgi:hypothetical protein